jgi:hypothetical protein
MSTRAHVGTNLNTSFQLPGFLFSYLFFLMATPAGVQ